ncbi:YceI family protein [Hymenobacter volaticus]|uniref:YceI family protein n=1 Tax=Hymenobacter volaticus TaxID=2932254 RepID=A0ABY4GF98_9BACT|nr:YceI family protein [Hymenobacter volaticus]UOQ69484.1 YceI family protein [Hymenobacter volaticus]UOQ69491.1 YceI family protein [Hymenobacter volaticus]
MKPIYCWPLLVLWLLCVPKAHAQKYLTRDGVVTFFSTSILEDIEARTEQVAALVDLNSNQVAFTIPIKSFQFKRTLMQEHFNENYMESGRFPKSSFSGRILDLNMEALQKGGSQRVTVEGDITIHGVTKHVQVPGALELQKGSLLVHAYFSVAPADYNIEIPLLVRENIAKIVGIRLALSCEPIAQLSLTK